MPELNINYTSNASMMDDSNDLLQELSRAHAQKFLPLICVVGLLMVVGFIGNSVVVYVYWFKLHGSAKSIFILALALMDLTVCSLVIPFEIYDLSHQFTFYSDNFCKAIRMLEYAAVLSAGFALVAVSFERYYSICKTFKDFTPKKAQIICYVSVLVAIVMAIPSAIFAGAKKRPVPKHNITGCECAMDTSGDKAEFLKQLYYCFLAAVFICCCITFTVLYSMIATILCRFKKGALFKGISMDNLNSTQRTTGSQDNHSVHSHNPASATSTHMHVHGRRGLKSLSTTAVFFSVTVVFVASFLPHLGTRLVQFLDIPIVDNLSEEDLELLYNILVRSYLISNVANPFIYSILNAKFRTELIQTFKRLCRKHSKSQLVR